MKKQLRVVVAAVCAFAMVGAFALTGCSSNSGSSEQKNDSATEHTIEHGIFRDDSRRFLGRNRINPLRCDLRA